MTLQADRVRELLEERDSELEIEDISQGEGASVIDCEDTLHDPPSKYRVLEPTSIQDLYASFIRKAPATMVIEEFGEVSMLINRIHIDAGSFGGTITEPPVLAGVKANGVILGDERWIKM